MSDDLVNQLTLNFLISKNQLQKLNKKVKETSDQQKLREMQEYHDRIKQLFCDLLVCQPPDDLLFEVKNTFDNFIEKAIYYFRAHDNNNALEFERTQNNTDDTQDDIDYEREEREIENGNYKERSDSKDEEEEEGQDEEEEGQDEEEEEEVYKSLETNKNVIHDPVIVKSKYKNTSNSVGVDDIQKLPLDWFQNVRQSYKKNQIIPRKKESIIEQPFRDLKKKI